MKKAGKQEQNEEFLKKQTEIDIMGARGNEAALFGECKWTNESADSDAVETLVHRADLFPYSEKHLCIFAKRGFTARCMNAADRYPDLKLVTFEEIMRLLDP